MGADKEPATAQELYSNITEWEAKRFKESSQMLAPYVRVTDDYGVLMCRVMLILGKIPPVDTQDKVIRDLMADVFDFLYESRSLLLRNKCEGAYLLTRRAYESLSLLTLCCLDQNYAMKWHSGATIENAEVRRELAKHPLGEAEQSTRDFYRFFSNAGHPNRDFVGERFLGEGNEFVLSPYFLRPLTLITHYCIKLLSLWYWFAATVSYHYRDVIAAHDSDYGENYLAVAQCARDVADSLVENLNRLIKEKD
jgi:hypothetical protein